MRLAVTGGCGFLGYHLCNSLSDKYEEIIIIDVVNFEEKEYPKNTRYIKCDVRDFSLLENCLKGCDAIVHAASALPLWKDKDIFTTTIEGTENVLRIAFKNKIKRVVYISSTAVYGVPERHPIYEDFPLIGVGPYGKAKIKAEGLCEEYRKKGLVVSIIRPKTFIGRGRLGIFQILYDWVKSGKKIPIIGNGKNRYQLLEVEDLTDAIWLLLTLPEERVNDVFNVGAKEFGSVYSDLDALCKYAKNGSSVFPCPSWAIKPLLELFWRMRISPIYEWVYQTADKDSFVSIEKIEKALGWLPKYSNSTSLIRSYEWYLTNCEEIPKEGITHRLRWKQGILGLFKRFL